VTRAAPDVPPDAPAPDPPPADVPAPAPARGTLASYLAGAAARLGAGGPYLVATVRAVGLDRMTASLDFERPGVVTELEVELSGPGGRCLLYAIDADRLEHIVPHSGCGPALDPPLPDLVAAIALGASRCRGTASGSGPVDVSLRPGEGGALVEVRERSGGWGFDAASDARGRLRVVPGSCRRGEAGHPVEPPAPADRVRHDGRHPPVRGPARPSDADRASSPPGSAVMNPWEP
jgi:hypothetical protein